MLKTPSVRNGAQAGENERKKRLCEVKSTAVSYPSKKKAPLTEDCRRSRPGGAGVAIPNMRVFHRPALADKIFNKRASACYYGSPSLVFRCIIPRERRNRTRDSQIELGDARQTPSSFLSKVLDRLLTDAALFNVERFWRRSVELRARKGAAGAASS
jgi:hypothetical protein